MSNFTSIKIGHNLDFLSGFAFPSINFNQNKRGKALIRIRDLLSNSIEAFFDGEFEDRFLIQNGDVLVGMDGDFNVVIWRKGEALLNQRVLKVSEKKDSQVDLIFFYYWLLVNLPLINDKTSGTTVKHLVVSDISDLDVDFPEKKHQKAIATILSTIDEAIAAAEAQLAKQEKIKQGLLQDLLTRGIDETGQIRPHWEDRPELYKKTELGFIPNNWTTNVLGHLIDSLESGVSVNSNDRIKGPHEKGILKTSCLSGGVFRPIEHKAVLLTEESRLSTPIRGDSIIISRMNTPLLVGESAYVEQDIHDIFLPDRLWITRMKDNPRTCVKWLSYVLRSPRVRDLISNLATGTSGSMKNIAKGSLLGINLAIPKPEEQEQISDVIDSNSNQSDSIKIELKKLAAIKSGLMQDLLTGQRRVTPELIRQVETLTGPA